MGTWRKSGVGGKEVKGHKFCNKWEVKLFAKVGVVYKVEIQKPSRDLGQIL